MRALIQQVSQAQVKSSENYLEKISYGLLVFLAIREDDELKDCKKMAQKIAKLRIFEDKEGKMNLSIKEFGGEVLLISQFTLYGDLNSGNRPSFVRSAKAEKAKKYYLQVIDDLRGLGLIVKQGKFQENMEVNLTNIGPKTIIIDL